MFNPRTARQKQQQPQSTQQPTQQQHRQQQLEIQKKQAKAERVRKLWAEFDQWRKLPRTEMERERDQLIIQTSGQGQVASRRRVEEAHFSKAREEWQRRLKAADLKESDWDPITEAEMKAVEEALGVEDGEGYITDPSPPPPNSFHPPLPRNMFSSASSTAAAAALPPTPAATAADVTPFGHQQSGIAVAAPPITSASRTTSASSSYECVRPEEFHSDDDESTSDSELSSFSSTMTSIISEEEETVAPAAEYMYSQALEASSPFLSRPLEVPKDNGPLLTRSAHVPSKSTDAATLAPPKRPPDTKAPQPSVSRASSTSSVSSSASSAAAAAQRSSAKTSPPVAASTSTSSSSSSQSSKASTRIQYPLVGPSLSDLSDFDEVDNDPEVFGNNNNNKRPSPSLVSQFEARFEQRKLQIRIQKVREFHQLACDADIELCINIANGRRDRTLSRQVEAQLVEEHYQRTVALRERMERERKEQVNEEKKQMRVELTHRGSISSSTAQQQPNGLRQQRIVPPPPSADSEESEDDDVGDEMRRKLEKMRQEQLALQAKFNSHEAPTGQSATPRKRAGTLTSESAPTPLIAMNHKKLDEPDDVLTPRLMPRPTPTNSAWSTRSSASAGAANRNFVSVLNQNLSRRGEREPQPEIFEQQLTQQDVDAVDLEADAEDDDQEKENSGLSSYPMSPPKKKVPAPPSQSPWNFPGVSKSPQKAQNTPKSRLGVSVTSAWDDEFGADEGVAAGDREGEKEDASQDKTPVIPSAPAPSSLLTIRKPTKKQRQANKKGGAVAATPLSPAKAENPTAMVPSTQKAQPASGPSMQKGQQGKTVPIAVPGKSGRKISLAESDDLSSTPKPSALKRIQAQLANGENTNEQEDETPTTPRPALSKKGGALQGNSPWGGRTIGKAASKALVDSAFGVTDSMDASPGATSSRTTLDQMKASDVASSPQVPGAWQWGTAPNSKGKNQVEPTTAGPRKNSSGRQTASSAATNGTNMESSKKKGKKPQRPALAKHTTVEEVPDDEGDELIPGSQGDNLPFNSRSILEERNIPEELEQPRIHEPRPSKPRIMFENIFQYGEAATAPDPDLVHDLRDELAWTEERIAMAVARMAQESAEMERKVKGRQPAGSTVPASSGVGIGLNGIGGINMNGDDALDGFGMLKTTAVVDTPHVPKQVRWQPSNIGLSDPPRSQGSASNWVRGYENETFSPLAANAGFPGLSYGTRTNGAVPGWPMINGKNQFALSGNLPDADPEGDELAKAARNLLENIHVGVSSQQRNKPGFAAV